MANKGLTLTVAGLTLAFILQAAEGPGGPPGREGWGREGRGRREHHEYKVDPSKLPPASTRQNLTFTADIKPMLDKSCVKCHSGNRPKGRLRLDTLENVLKGGHDGNDVVPGNSVASRILGYVSDLVPRMEMPPLKKRKEFTPLTKEQAGIIRAWIDQGAK